MAGYSHLPRVRWQRPGDRATLALALALFVGIFTLRMSDPNLGNAEGSFFVLPIALLAMRFGLRGGLGGALLAFMFVVAWGHFDHDTLMTARGYVSRATAFLTLGALLGTSVDRHRRSEAALSRSFDASLDLQATADLTGRFTRVNPAWERTLGHSAETMCSQPYLEFVHPDDREATIVEAAALADGSRDTVGFRNRYRAADGSYRWLEWSAHTSDGAINAVARDITVQQEAGEQLADNAMLLETRIAERTRELDDARAETLQRLAIAAEYRDDETFQHTERVGTTAAEIAERLGLGAEQIKLLREAAPLHDVGKLAIPDRILLKPGKLSLREYAVIKTHTTLGARLLTGSNSPVLQMAAAIAATHHERWDGTGYPAALAGEAIPLVGRVVAVADVFDALTHIRPYKSAWPVEQALTEIEWAAGSQFDPLVVAAFLELHKYASTPESEHPKQRARPVPARRKRANGPPTKPAPQPSRHA